MYINKYHGNYNISKRTQSVKYIVIHYVGSGSSTSGNAKNNCIFFAGGNRNSSAHYFIDDGGIWEYADPSSYYTWHCGDGHGKYGITNANSIGIEVCQNGDKPFTEKEIGYLSELVPSLMAKYGVPANNIVRHYDASRKSCPLYYVSRSSEWTTLKRRITGSVNGWVTENGAWYYYKNGVKLTNAWQTDSVGWCYLAGNGKLVTNEWINWQGDWYYLDAGGHMLENKWQMDSVGWCYLGKGGKMLHNTWLSWNGNSYFMKKDGRMATGSINILETFDQSGKWIGGKQA